MIPAIPQLTPDADEARSWLEEELSRVEYSNTLGPLRGLIRSILQAIVDLFSGTDSGRHIPLELLLLGFFTILLIAVVLIVIFNPIRLRARAHSAQIFDSDVTLNDANRCLQEAKDRDSWDEAYIWAFRVLVLTLAQLSILRDGPGLTAREAVGQAVMKLKDETAIRNIEGMATHFDAIRYGTDTASHQQVHSVELFVASLPQLVINTSVGGGA